LPSRRTKAADFHRLRTPEDFDWRFNPNIPRKQMFAEVRIGLVIGKWQCEKKANNRGVCSLRLSKHGLR
jgi:hypothetical protein